MRDVAKVRPEPSANGVLGNPERAKTRDSEANGTTSVGRNPTNTPSQQIATCETVELAVGGRHRRAKGTTWSQRRKHSGSAPKKRHHLRRDQQRYVRRGKNLEVCKGSDFTRIMSFKMP
jgi:hypothetical protein